MSSALIQRPMLQKQQQQFMRNQRDLLNHFGPFFGNQQDSFFDEFFNDHDFLTPLDVFNKDPFFSRMKRASDNEVEKEREVKRPKAKIINEMRKNDDGAETKEEMFEPYQRCYSYHTSSITNNGKTKTYTKRRYQDHKGYEYEVEEKVLPNGQALIYEKEIEDDKTIKESQHLRNHLEKNVDKQAITNFNKEWEQMLNNNKKKAIENIETTTKETEN